MWFKNLRVYQLTESIITDGLSTLLEKFPFVPCANLDRFKSGFVAPLGRGHTQLTHQALNFIMLCVKAQEKIIPAAAVNEKLADKVEAIQEAESRHVGRKERETLKDEIIFSMLPKALTKSSLEYFYIDVTKNLIICNTTSAKKAEDCISLLRSALGGLRCIPVTVNSVTSQVMTNIVKHNIAPQHFAIGEDADFSSGKDRRTIKCKNLDLSADEIQAHINSGMYVSKLALSYKSSIFFNVDEDIAIKQLNFSDLIQEKCNERNPETKAEQFDAYFTIMAKEVGDLLDDVFAMFGGAVAVHGADA